MRQQYAKVKGLIEMIRGRKSSGETNREIAASLGLPLKQIRQLIHRENRRERTALRQVDRKNKPCRRIA